MTSYIAVHYRKLNENGKLREKQYVTALEEMLFMTSHKVRRPVASIIGLIDVINLEADLSVNGLKEYCQFLSSSANELDAFTKELNAFIMEAKQQGHIIGSKVPLSN